MLTKKQNAAMTAVIPTSLHILGSGSIGLLFASSLRRAKPTYPVTLLLRGGRGHDTRLAGGCISASVTKSRDEAFDIKLPAEIISLPEFQHWTSIKNLLIATKAADAATALSSVMHRLDRNGANIIILCNGAMAVRDDITAILKGSGTNFEDNMRDETEQRSESMNKTVRLILASTTHGAYRTNNSDGKGNTNAYSIVHAGIGRTYVEDDSIANLFDTAGLCAEYATPTQMHVLLWKKLATNCAINPLTALNRCQNGELLAGDEKTIATMNEILKEVSAVAIAESKNMGMPSEILDELQYEPLRNFVDDVIHATARNTSSMLQDVLAGRKTEVKWLNGYLARLGMQKHQISCPMNETMRDKVESLRP